MVDYRGIDEKNVQEALDTLAEEVVAEVAVDVAVVQAEVDAVEVDVLAAEADIGILQTNIANAQTDIGILQTDITNAQNEINSIQNGFFLSSLLTGTGVEQNIPHGLGVVPTKVAVIIQDHTHPVNFTYGIHDSTNVKITMSSSSDTYLVLAIGF